MKTWTTIQVVFAGNNDLAKNYANMARYEYFDT